MTHLIELKDVYKIYPMGDETVHALDGVSLSIDQGEFVAIVGSSGSGKSTAMNIIGCLDVPTSGSYHLGGVDVSTMDDDQQADLYLWMVGRLARAGYPQYEISNFAKPGFESRHNLRYWFTRPYIGFGPGAHSDFGGRRYSFVRDLDAYIDGVLHGGNVIDSSELIPQRERCGEYLMLRLRTAQGIDGVEYRRNYFMDFAPLEARLEQFAAQGWVERSPEGRWHFTPKGFLVSNQLIGDLLDRQEQASWEDLIVRPERGPRP